MPAPSIAVMQNVTLTSGDVITSGESLLSIDPASNPAFSFVAGHQGVVVGTHAHLGAAAVLVPKNAGPFITEGILLSSRADANWFHWLIETLPKLLYLDAEVPEDVPIIISARIPKTAKECLRLLTDRTIIEILPEEATRVGKLFVASPVLFHPDPVELHLNPVTNTINMESLIWLRQRILNEAKKAITETSDAQSIYVARSSGSRSLVNPRQVATTLRRFGFVVHDPANMSFLEQVVAFHSAKRIVLVGGASMANLVFCSEGAAVVTLRSKFTAGYKMPEILAGVSGAILLSVSGRPVGNAFRSSFLEKVHAHYYVGIRDLSNAVRRIL
jgi:capsular polysaccharide biosynthesis protein